MDNASRNATASKKCSRRMRRNRLFEVGYAVACTHPDAASCRRLAEKVRAGTLERASCSLSMSYQCFLFARSSKLDRGKQSIGSLGIPVACHRLGHVSKSPMLPFTSTNMCCSGAHINMIGDPAAYLQSTQGPVSTGNNCLSSDCNGTTLLMGSHTLAVGVLCMSLNAVGAFGVRPFRQQRMQKLICSNSAQCGPSDLKAIDLQQISTVLTKRSEGKACQMKAFP